MRHYFILNPAAGKRDRSPEFRQIIEAVCGGNGLDYEISVSQAPGHCKALAAQAAAKGEPCRIYACGGDGTLNEIVNGIVGLPNAAVTHFPARISANTSGFPWSAGRAPTFCPPWSMWPIRSTSTT